jgi:hypothetical protein
MTSITASRETDALVLFMGLILASFFLCFFSVGCRLPTACLFYQALLKTRL